MSSLQLHPREFRHGSALDLFYERDNYGFVSKLVRGTTLESCLVKTIQMVRDHATFGATVDRIASVKHCALAPIIGFSLPPQIAPSEFAEDTWRDALLVEKLSGPLFLTNIGHESANSDFPTVSMTATQKSVAMYGLASALKALHGNGITAGPFWPTNVNFNAQFEPHVCFYGLDMLASPDADVCYNYNPREVSICIPPEHYERASGVSMEGDVFAFAVMCAWIINGEEPFSECSNGKQVMDATRAGTRVPLPKELPEPLVSVINKCWEANPAARPKAGEIVAVLESNVVPGTDLAVFEEYKEKCKA